MKGIINSVNVIYVENIYTQKFNESMGISKESNDLFFVYRNQDVTQQQGVEKQDQSLYFTMTNYS